LLTCKEFLAELNDFLDEKTKGEIRSKLERHLAECPNCWVVCDTTRKTIKVYKGMSACTVPEDIHLRLMAAVERKTAAAGKDNTATNERE
jgi:anti-sigma factor RsiW